MILNGKVYVIPEITFGTIIDLEELGFSITDFQKRPLSGIRAFVALAMKGNVEQANKEIQEHIVNGGGFEEISEEIRKAIEESDFFRNLQKNKKQEITEDTIQEAT